MVLHSIDVAKITAPRKGEKKIGQIIASCQNLADLNQTTAKFALLFIAEEIGPIANHGRPGAINGADAFLSVFLNMQHHESKNSNFHPGEMFDGNQFVLTGKLDFQELQSQATQLSIEKNESELCQLVNRMSEEATPIFHRLFASNKFPIIIGGGDNWGYECVSAVAKAYHSKVVLINFDPHADMRALTAIDNVVLRHSGNWATLALKEELLAHYFPVGLDFNYNNAFILDSLNQDHISFKKWTKKQIIQNGMTSVIEELIHTVQQKFPKNPIVLNFDTDSIANMPASAYNPDGITPHDAYNAVARITRVFKHNLKTLRLSEMAPDPTIRESMLMAGRISTHIMQAMVSHLA